MIKKKVSERRKLSSKQYNGILLILLFLLLFSISVSVTFGNANITWKEVYGVIGYELFHINGLSEFATGAIHDVVWLIRFPRVMLALAIGMGLSVCGTVMQAVVKNPLADPYILGVSSGASMGATLGILFGVGYLFGTNFVGIVAFLGAMLTSFFVLFIANIRGRANTGKLILMGMAVSAVCSAISNFAIYIANDNNATTEILFWTLGSLASAKWDKVVVILPLLIIGTFIFWLQSRNLNLMLLGDEAAITLGTDLQKTRNLYMILASLMIGFCVYASGTIGFVGLIIPHAMRMCFGTDHKRLIPICAIVGGIFLIWADVLCRVILKNSELPLGILVSIIGAPCFIYLMLKHSYGFGGRDSSTTHH